MAQAEALGIHPHTPFYCKKWDPGREGGLATVSKGGNSSHNTSFPSPLPLCAAPTLPLQQRWALSVVLNCHPQRGLPFSTL